MYAEERKKCLLEAVLKVSDEAVLTELETVVKRKKLKLEKTKLSAHNFLGKWRKKDAALIERAIEESKKLVNYLISKTNQPLKLINQSNEP